MYVILWDTSVQIKVFLVWLYYGNLIMNKSDLLQQLSDCWCIILVDGNTDGLLRLFIILLIYRSIIIWEKGPIGN